MNRYLYRELRPAETKQIGAIDRSESIAAVYRSEGMALRLEPLAQTATPWQGAELDAYVARLEAVVASGGRAFGAWESTRLVGVAVLDVSGVGGERDLMRLDMLYVSASARGHGVGRGLLDRVAAQARALGATRLYISATPTQGTVDAYLRLGARLLERPDPESFAREPEDIHLCLWLS